jgi:hypothetical protein
MASFMREIREMRIFVAISMMVMRNLCKYFNNSFNPGFLEKRAIRILKITIFKTVLCLENQICGTCYFTDFLTPLLSVTVLTFRE